MALKEIEFVNGHIIQKIVAPDNTKTFRYQVVPPGGLGNSNVIKIAMTLSEAREKAGHKPVAPQILTVPKMSHMHNQPGYRADNQRAKKAGGK